MVVNGRNADKAVKAADRLRETAGAEVEVAAAFVHRHRSSSILQRAASVEEGANLVAYLVSPFASATTGRQCGSAAR